jgi:NAD(P)-dependent dehydrogenase (short-subunit alcohol dehydrogenase family)
MSDARSVELPFTMPRAVAMLLSPQSAWINGQRIEVSGGMNL